MRKKVIDEEMMMHDIRSATCSARALKQRIIVAREDNDIYSRIENFIKNQGYVFTISRERGTFNISASANLSVTGKVGKIYIYLGFVIHFDGLVVSNTSAQCGDVKFPVTDLDVCLPLIEKMISDGKALGEKYLVLRKKEKTAELLETLVREYLKDVSNIYVQPDETGTLWLLKNVYRDTLVRVPIDFENYQSQCDAWLKVVNNEELWKIEHKETQVQVLEANHSYGTRVDWRNMATGEWYNNLKV